MDAPTRGELVSALDNTRPPKPPDTHGPWTVGNAGVEGRTVTRWVWMDWIGRWTAIVDWENRADKDAT